MKQIKKTILFFILCLMHQSHECAFNSATTLNSSYNNPRHAALRLINESYITPEMQWEILTLLQAQFMNINPHTGSVQGIESLPELLEIIQGKLFYSITATEKDIIKNALHTMLEAVEIALFVAKIEAEYEDQKFIFYQNINEQLLEILKMHQQGIHAAIKAVNATIPTDQIEQQSSYFSWFYSSPTPTTQAQTNDNEAMIIPFNPQSPVVQIPAQFIPTLIKNNDYKQKSDPQQAAQLLFQQCFIAQQHHLKDQTRINAIRINLQSPIHKNNYIYTNFPNFYDICLIAKNLVMNSQPRYNLQDPLTEQHKQAHQLLLHTRQAVQTALYIANKKSPMYIGYILPNSVIAYLDGIINQLLQYDTQLSELCKNPLYGATLEDTYQAEKLATLTKVAAGIAVTAASLAALQYFAPTALGSIAQTGYNYLTQAGTGLINWWNGSNSSPNNNNNLPASQATSQTPQQNGWFSGWWGSSNNNQSPQADQSQPTTITSTLKKAASYGSVAAQAATAASLLMQGTQFAGSQGIISLDPMTQSAIDTANRITSVAGAVTGTIGGTAKATVDLLGSNWNTLFGIVNVINSGWNAAQGAQNIAQMGKYFIYKLQNVPGQDDNQQQPVLQQNTTLPPQNIYNGFAKKIDMNIAQGINPLPNIQAGITYVIKEKLIEQHQLAFVLQKLQERYAQVPAIAESLEHYLQELTPESAHTIQPDTALAQ